MSQYSLTTPGGTTMSGGDGCVSATGTLVGIPYLNVGHSGTVCKDGNTTQCLTWQLGPFGGEHCASGKIKPKGKGKR